MHARISMNLPTWNNEPMRVNKAVFPVAGLGTRFLPATKANPKEMLPVVDKPLIQYTVEEAYSAGIRQMIFESPVRLATFSKGCNNHGQQLVVGVMYVDGKYGYFYGTETPLDGSMKYRYDCLRFVAKDSEQTYQSVLEEFKTYVEGLKTSV